MLEAAVAVAVYRQPGLEHPYTQVYGEYWSVATAWCGYSEECCHQEESFPTDLDRRWARPVQCC